MKVIITALIFLIHTIACEIKKSEDNVIMIIEMARHGARAPIMDIYKRPWIEETGAGELTTIGERQRYNLGRQTRDKYPKLFTTKRMKPEEVWVRSTSFNRTIMSAVSHVSGLFELIDDTVTLQFENDDPRLFPPQDMINPPTKDGFRTPLPKGSIPFPIHSRIGVDPEMWIFGACHNTEVIKDDTFKAYSDKLAKSEKFMTMYNDVLKKYNLDKDWMKDTLLSTRCFNLGDFYIMDIKDSNDPIIPENYEYGDLLKRCYDLGIYGTYTDREMSKATITPILNQIQKYFKDKTVSDKAKQIPLKYVQYSGHDDTIGAHLVVYNMANPECVQKSLVSGESETFDKCPHHPYTASNLIWELIDGINETKDLGVKVSYNGVYIDYCQNAKKDKYGDFFCTLTDFNNIVDTKYTKNWDGYCVNPSKTTDKPSNQYIVVILMIVVVLLLLVIIALAIKVSKLNNLQQVKTLFN